MQIRGGEWDVDVAVCVDEWPLTNAPVANQQRNLHLEAKSAGILELKD